MEEVYSTFPLSSFSSLFEESAVWDCVQCGIMCSVGAVCIIYGGIVYNAALCKCGIVYSVASCAVWDCVQCGIVYSVGSCTVWHHVQCGIMYSVGLCTL